MTSADILKRMDVVAARAAGAFARRPPAGKPTGPELWKAGERQAHTFLMAAASRVRAATLLHVSASTALHLERLTFIEYVGLLGAVMLKAEREGANHEREGLTDIATMAKSCRDTLYAAIDEWGEWERAADAHEYKERGL